MGVAELIDPNASLWDWLAYDVRFYRKKRNETLDELGTVLSRTKAWVSNVEAGRRRVGNEEAKLLDAHWDTGGHFVRLLRYARLGHDPDWFRQHVQYEAKASVLRIWELAWIPGLLQTEDYARATLLAGGIKDVETLLEARMARQEILSRQDPPILWVLIWEPALETPVGGRKVFAAQLGRLLEISEDPNVAIRVVPKAAGGHPGLEGAFKIMTLESEEIAYVEALGGGRLVSGAEVRSHALRYDRIGQQALPEGLARDLIKQAMEAMSP